MTAAKTLAYRFPYRLGKMAILLAIVAFVGVHTVLTHRMVMEMLIARDGAVDPLSLSLLQAMAGLAALLALGVIGAILYRGALSLHLSDSGVEVRRLARPPSTSPGMKSTVPSCANASTPTPWSSSAMGGATASPSTTPRPCTEAQRRPEARPRPIPPRTRWCCA